MLTGRGLAFEILARLRTQFGNPNAEGGLGLTERAWQYRNDVAARTDVVRWEYQVAGLPLALDQVRVGHNWFGNGCRGA
ncbi:hypothetical protein C7S18_11415 [Ahniella affigens]|uniref:Uncharacterized protein n=1 Tax=Ahniella affigens TaxID=2021234 RepID=A0A2P1PSF0_9GAMM|nr:hypothetical protein C7S18_11415 [Ahniella affigens]